MHNDNYLCSKVRFKGVYYSLHFNSKQNNIIRKKLDKPKFESDSEMDLQSKENKAKI